ncbi:MAG: permease [Thermincola sp.]|jgi:uncharacterized membrane protein YraQ (UPF0718 family)|nr:permease [Thermincola sp.]MDT3703985.1 permease [Thermincola sp.]
MQKVSSKSYLSFGVKILLLLFLVQFLFNPVWRTGIVKNVDYQMVQMFTTIFVSILLEAFPFILLGVIISSLIQVFVSEEFIARVIPKNGIKGVLLGTILGFFFPVCDCSVIPVVRRLIQKGVPVYIALIFMLCAPIINPVVLLATNYAFNNALPQMVFYRSFLGVFLAVVIAYVLHKMTGNNPILKSSHHYHSHCGCDSCHHDHSPKRNGIITILSHVEQEFFDVAKYLIMGAFIASLSQVILPRDVLLGAGQNKGLSTFIMMFFSYVISLCSTSDSFIARTFIGQFTNSSILGFLILGPMLDIKNTIVLLGNFKTKFVVSFLIVTFVVVFAGVYLADFLIGY